MSETESETETETEVDAAIGRLRGAIAGQGTVALADVTTLLGELERVRVESAARWDAIGRLAPAAKAQRTRARDATRLLDELRAAVARGEDVAPLLVRPPAEK